MKTPDNLVYKLVLIVICACIFFGVRRVWLSHGPRRRPNTTSIALAAPLSGGLAKNVTIALVIPCIPDHIPQVKKLVAALEKQTRLPDEVIIAASETTEDEARSLERALTTKKIKVQVTELSGKAYAGKNRNRGADLAKSDLISFMDADDQMHPQRLEILLSVYGKTRSRAILHTYIMHENGESLPGNVEKVEIYGAKIFHDQQEVVKHPHFEHWPFELPLHHGHVTVEKSLFDSVRQDENMKREQDANFLRSILTEFPGDRRTMCGVDFPLSIYQPKFSSRDPEPLDIRFVVSACNEKSEYLAAIPDFILAWQTFYPRVTIKILLVMNEIPEHLREFSNYFVLFPPLKGISTAFTAQFIRILFPPLLPGEGGVQNGGVVLSDIDLIPTNNTFFSDATFTGITTLAFVNMRGDSQVPKDQIAIAYSVATPLIWQQINNITSMDAIKKKLREVHDRVRYQDGRQQGWEADQKELYKMVEKWKKSGGEYVELNSKQTGFDRLHKKEIALTEEDFLAGILDNDTKVRLQQGAYSDYHMLHPVGKYRKFDEQVLKTSTSRLLDE